MCVYTNVRHCLKILLNIFINIFNIDSALLCLQSILTSQEHINKFLYSRRQNIINRFYINTISYSSYTHVVGPFTMISVCFELVEIMSMVTYDLVGRLYQEFQILCLVTIKRPFKLLSNIICMSVLYACISAVKSKNILSLLSA